MTTAPSTLFELETPCLVADRARIEANAARMRERASAHGVTLRPHVKTTKSAAIARIAHGGCEGPITVSTLREADYFYANGFRDMTYAVCITPNKFPHAARLAGGGADLKVLLASDAIAAALAEFAEGQGVTIRVMIEIDSGEHRTGLLPDSAELLSAARRVAGATHLRLEGLLTHGGHSYGCRTREQMAAVADEERTSLLRAREALAKQGIEVSSLSSGSTPTATFGRDFSGLDELRPGVYLGGDLFQAELGTCAIEDIAISVLASVIAHDPARNRLVIDAGGLALSKDRSTQKSPLDYGYGLLARADGERFCSDMIVADVHQEHGEVVSDARIPFGDLPVGSLVRVLPNHVCMTAASYEKYRVVSGRDASIVDTWDKTLGW